MLDDTQQRVFDRLAVFVGGFRIEAAEAIVAGDGVDDWEVLDAVFSLVDKSLVVADEDTGGTRYRLLETMRQFGQANLVDAGIDVVYRDRHADYFTEFVSSRRPQLHGSGDVAAGDAIERELDNIRVALRQAAGDHTSSRFEELFATLYSLWQHGRSSEAAAWSTELRHRPDLDPRARIVALGCATGVTNYTNLAAAKEFAETADALWEATTPRPRSRRSPQ